MRRVALALAIVSACDGEKVDVVGLERKVEMLEQQQREAAEARNALEAELAEDDKARVRLEAQLEEANASIASLEARVVELETPKKPELPKAISGRAVSGERYKIELGDAHTRGNADARVTIVMFSDFQCPFCKRAMTTVAEVEKAYGKDVRFAMKHNPLAFHKSALPAALAAEAAGKQGKFWEMHDLLYENGRDLTDANFVKWARALKLDVKRFENDLDDAGSSDKVSDDQALALAVGARGTPAFFINGRHLSGAQPFDAFKKIIDEELVEADKLIAAGTPASGVYEKIIATGKEKAE